MAALNNIQEAQKKQGDEDKSLSERIYHIENYEYDNEYENYDDDYQEQDEGEENEGITEPPPKKQRQDTNNNTSRFSSMAKRCRVYEICDSKLDDFLAENITDLFRNGMNEDQYIELTKDENTARPENCEGLTIVRTNQLIWNVLSPMAQTADKKLQFIEKSVIKAAIILTKTVNEMAQNDQVAEKDDGPNMNEYIDKCNDVLALLGHANRQINTTRRDFPKPELMSEYLHLCSHSVPFTKWLFGDDVSKTAKDIEDCSKISFALDVGEVDIEVAEVTVVVEVATVETEEPEAGACPLGTRYQNIPHKNFQRGGNSQAQQRDKN